MESQWNHRGPEASYIDRCWWWGLGDDSSRWHDSWTSAGRPSDAATILIFQYILVQPPLKRFHRDLFPHQTRFVFLWFPLISCIVVVFLSSSFDSWVPRHRDTGLFGGCVFVKLSGHVANATAPQASFLIGISPFGEGWLSGKRNNHYISIGDAWWGCSLPHEFCWPRSTGQSNGLIQSSAPVLHDERIERCLFYKCDISIY